MQMTPQKELELALADLAAAEAELAKAKAELAAAETEAAKRPRARKVQRKATPKPRPVHHSELRSEVHGVGQRFTSDGKIRIDDAPVVTKELDPMSRPNDYKYEGHECLLVFDVEQGFMESDSWMRCKCAACAEIRRG